MQCLSFQLIKFNTSEQCLQTAKVHHAGSPGVRKPAIQQQINHAMYLLNSRISGLHLIYFHCPPRRGSVWRAANSLDEFEVNESAPIALMLTPRTIRRFRYSRRQHTSFFNGELLDNDQSFSSCFCS